MDVNNKYVKILLATTLLIVFSLVTLLVWQYVLALVFMEDEITFSASVLITFLSSPLLIYAMLSGIYFLFSISAQNTTKESLDIWFI